MSTIPRSGAVLVFVALALCAGTALAGPKRARTASSAPPAPSQGVDAHGAFDALGDVGQLVASARWDAKRRSYVAPLDGGREAELTLERGLQEDVTALVGGFKVPYASVVALDPRDGRILAMTETSDRPDGTGATTKAIFPAASIFKIVTGAALLEAGISPETEVCFHGGLHALKARELKDDPRRDNRCATLATAMGKSLNVVFGKLAAKTLSAEGLRAMAGRFFFNQPLPVFPSPAGLDDALVSRAHIPEDGLEFGKAAAGFGKVYLSPLHGALLAGTVANRGVAAEPRLVRAVSVAGTRVEAPAARETRIMEETTSALLTRMMERTVSDGTARKFFRTRRGRNALGAVTIAGKTGSLADHAPLPFKDYSWFVGFAPADDPKVAIAAVVVNGPKWRVKAPYLAAETLKAYFDGPGGAPKHASR
jgi:cell division protein FtsI/penicillin-binding protein 2